MKKRSVDLDAIGPAPVAPPSVRLAWPAWALGLLCALLAMNLVGCGAAAPPTEEVSQAEIQTMLEAYLPVLGTAYAERNPKLIADYAVPKEQARIQLRIEELTAKGQIYEPIFSSVTVESVSVWNYSNAYASTVEVWDVSAYTLGSKQLVNQSLGQRSRVKYQLKRKDDGWVVLYRELEQTSDS
ncbi:MAG: IMS domain-containing protein [Acidobacteriota bacterium]